ncbi:MAG: hypothetical protein HQL70_05275, partial [Magnetococcales bacterium]|nr:hypothetical protein [Magnetococcales bacterium]
TTDFLIFSRPTATTRQPIVLLDFVNGVAEQVKTDPCWGNNRKLTCTISAQTTVLFDSNQLRQIFWNLLINSSQAAPDGGEITISSHPSPNSNKQQIIIVEDDGPGLDRNLLEKALEPFFTTRSAGTGLGLAVVTQLLHKNGGSINLQPGTKRGLRVLLTVEKANG